MELRSMKRLARTLTVVSAVLPLLLLSAISVKGAEPGTGDPVMLGVIHNEKFPFAEMMRNSYDMALEAINTQGGINGRPLSLVYADDQGKAKAGERATKELKQKGAVMLLGGYSSSNTVYTAGMAQKLDIPFLVITAADDRITQRGWENIFRLNPPASRYTNSLEDFFNRQIRPGSMSIVYENSPYGTDGALRMMWFCRENGIEIKKIIPYHKERTDSKYMQRILSPLKDENPDVIYMVSYLKDALALVKEIRALGINSLLAGGAGGFTHPDFAAKGGAAADRTITATLWYQEIPYPGTREYFDQYRKKFGQNPDYHGAEAYSGLVVAADALTRASRLDPDGIRRALGDTNLSTPFGPVRFGSFDKYERQNTLPTQVLQIVEGGFEIVWPADLATSPFLPPPGWKSP